ncbi:putative protein kinase IRE1 family [Medicago truncatula]|nr:putative protein kinase IRE1 family [Medicago truncatula]
MKVLPWFLFLFLFSFFQDCCCVHAPPPNKATKLIPTKLFATPDGTIYFVANYENGRTRILWSFSTGSPTYSSYQAPGATDFLECEDDWSLYMQDEYYGKLIILQSIGEVVDLAPMISYKGEATIGSKKITSFQVDAKTGSVSTNSKNFAGLRNLNASKPLLINIYRKDLFLKYDGPTSGSGFWNLTVAEFDAVLLCQHLTTFHIEDLNFKMPYPCKKKQKVFKLNKNFLLESLISESSHGAYHGKDTLSMPASDRMIQLQPNYDRFFNNHDGNMAMPPTPFPQQNDYKRKDKLRQPLTEISDLPGHAYLNKKSGWPTPSPTMFVILLVVVSHYCYLVVKGIKYKYIPKDTNREVSMNFNEGVDGEIIGELFVSKKEIGRGRRRTNATAVLHDGQSVAVKRLLKSRHSVALNEIKKLVSDHHQNIVRLYGVEYDEDFIYLALERCTCNLNDLVQVESGKDTTEYLWKKNDHPSPLLLKLMRGIVAGVVHLHKLGIIHGNLKPQNVLIIKDRSLSVKLSDMAITRHVPGKSVFAKSYCTGWHAPEQQQGTETRAVDIFSLGCILFFCLTKGSHPFGDDHLWRESNILNDRKDLSLVEFIPEAEDLISCLLNPDQNLR